MMWCFYYTAQLDFAFDVERNSFWREEFFLNAAQPSSILCFMAMEPSFVAKVHTFCDYRRIGLVLVKSTLQ